MTYSASTAAPAPRMLPVFGHDPPPGFGIGIALALNFVIEAVGSAADDVAGKPSAMTPSAARQIDALRIRFSLLCSMDIRLDPGSSGAIAGPAISRSPATGRGTMASCSATLCIARSACKLVPAAGASLHQPCKPPYFLGRKQL